MGEGPGKKRAGDGDSGVVFRHGGDCWVLVVQAQSLPRAVLFHFSGGLALLIHNTKNVLNRVGSFLDH